MREEILKFFNSRPGDSAPVPDSTSLKLRNFLESRLDADDFERVRQMVVETLESVLMTGRQEGAKELLRILSQGLEKETPELVRVQRLDPHTANVYVALIATLAKGLAERLGGDEANK